MSVEAQMAKDVGRVGEGRLDLGERDSCPVKLGKCIFRVGASQSWLGGKSATVVPVDTSPLEDRESLK